MIPIEELIKPVTTEQQYEKFLDIIEATGLKPRAWRPGGGLRTIIRAAAASYAAFSAIQVSIIRMAFLELAEGVWLTLMAFYVFGVTRRAATFASGEVTLTNAGALDMTFQPGVLRFINPTSKKAYANSDVVHTTPGSVLPVPIAAVEIGSASSASAGQITQLETVYAGLTVVNAAPVVGLDEASDPEVRQLCRDSRAGRSAAGPRGAYGRAVRSAVRTDGSPVNLNRVSISPASSTGIVTIYVASPSGVPTAEDLDDVVASVELLTRPDTVTVNVLGVTPLPVARTIEVWAEKREGLSAPDLTALVRSRLLALNATHPIGGQRKTTSQGYLFATTLEGEAERAHEAVYAVDGAGADVLMAAGEVVVLTITVIAHIVDPEVHA